MNHLVLGLFTDSKEAGQAVKALKNQGFAEEISLVAKDYGDTEVKTHEVKQDIRDGIAAGATTGALAGGIIGFLAGVTSVALPGGLLIAGPLATTLGAAGGAAGGAVAGGLVGTLVDMGIPDNQAREFENSISRGEILVAVSTNHNKELEVIDILDQHDVDQTEIIHKE